MTNLTPSLGVCSVTRLFLVTDCGCHCCPVHLGCWLSFPRSSGWAVSVRCVYCASPGAAASSIAKANMWLSIRLHCHERKQNSDIVGRGMSCRQRRLSSKGPCPLLLFCFVLSLYHSFISKVYWLRSVLNLWYRDLCSVYDCCSQGPPR